MITRHPLGITPSFELDIGGVDVDYTSIERIEIMLNESEHDMVVFRMAGIPAKAITDYLLAPVRLELRRGSSESQIFTGEVVEVTPVTELAKGAVNRSPFQTAEIRCLGSSYKMRGKRSKVWGPSTLTDIAISIADKYHFSVDVPKTNLIHTDSTQINKSDWAFLNELCDTYGYCVSVHGTHLHIWDPYKATGRQISYHILRSLKAVGGDVNPQPGVILSFSGNFSTQPAASGYTSVLDAQGNVTTVTSDQFSNSDNDSGLGKNYKSNYMSRVMASGKTIEEAELAMKAWLRSAIPFTATVETLGVLGVYPGGLIRIEGFDSHFDGLWYIQNVHQVLGGSGLVTTLQIVSDSTNEESPIIYNTQRFSEPPYPRYFNKEWVSSNRRVNVYN